MTFCSSAKISRMKFTIRPKKPDPASLVRVRAAVPARARDPADRVRVLVAAASSSSSSNDSSSYSSSSSSSTSTSSIESSSSTERPPRFLSATFALFHSDPSASWTRSTARMIVAGATGLEPATCGFGDRCATNCATPLCLRNERPPPRSPVPGHAAIGVTHPTGDQCTGTVLILPNPGLPLGRHPQLGPGLGENLLAAAGHGELDLGHTVGHALHGAADRDLGPAVVIGHHDRFREPDP